MRTASILGPALALLVISFTSTPLLAQQQPAQNADEVDYVALSAQLFKDGHYDRAARTLAEVDVTAEGVDHANYFTLRGLLALHEHRYGEAIKHFDDAIRHGKVDDVVFVYLAQAYYGQQDWKHTIRAIDNAGDEAAKFPSLFLIKARAHWHLAQHAAAFEVLSKGSRRFPDEPEFTRQRILLLLELRLYQEAMELAESFLTRPHATADDYLALAEALRRNREPRRAVALLERARLTYPDDVRIVRHLAHAWIDADQTLTAADLLQRAAEHEPELIVEAAELFRRAGAFERAMYMNAQITDQAQKFRQRVAILLDQRKFETVAALRPRLERLGLLEDQNVVYAVAYAHFEIGEHDRSEALLERIDDPALFESANGLRRFIAYCRANPDGC